MSKYIGRVVNIRGQEGEIVRTRGTSYYEVQPFDINRGSFIIRKDEVEQFLQPEHKAEGTYKHFNIQLTDYVDKHCTQHLRLKIKDILASNNEWLFHLENGYKRTFNVGEYISLEIYDKAQEKAVIVSGNIINLSSQGIILQQPKSYCTISCNFEDDEFTYLIF